MCLGIILAVSSNAIADNSPKNANYISYKSNKKAIDVSKISIGAIKLGMKEKDILKKFGKPKSRTVKYDDVCHNSYITTWKYNGLEINGLSTTNNPSQVKYI